MSSRREAAGGSQSTSNAPRQNVYFVPRDGIDREVITADICRYLGNDALVRPGTYQDPSTGQLMQGYHITAYRNLTSAMIQSLKEDSARWDTERRSRTAGSSSRFSGQSGAAYEISEPSYPKGSSRDSYEIVLPRYPGSDAPGYSGGGSSQQAYQQQYDNRQSSGGYASGQYSQGQSSFQSQSQGGDRYAAQPVQGSTYPSQAYGYVQQPEAGPPYVNVGAHSRAAESSSDRGYASGTAYPAGTYPPQGQDPRYYQGQSQSYAQPVDPVYGRGNQYPTTSQAEYSSAAQPVYQYDHPQYQTAVQTPTQDPRATTSSPISTQAQTGHSGSSSRHHRDRDHRESSSRHSRRPN
ncbi:hypothetical protein N0V82_006316 [Gnomoniopsis sp. IMI 355080]|nr:hypothetical protein N0V82_006316 [Gnomoniopsis sp. IMI 355080]